MGIRFRDRPRNVLIIGSAGSGKTVTCMNICVNIDAANQDDPDHPTILIIIDPKRDYRILARRLRGEVLYLSAQHNLRIGLNGPTDVPPNVSPTRQSYGDGAWIGALSVSIAARLGLVVSRACFAAMAGTRPARDAAGSTADPQG